MKRAPFPQTEHSFMVAEKLAEPASYVKASTRGNRRKRRLRYAAKAERVRRDELIRGVGPTIAQSPDFHSLAGCGWNPNDRPMRLREPPTRSSNGGFRLNRRNGWSMSGDAKKLVSPKEAAVWLWWLSLGDDAQDEVCDLSAKCSLGGDGGTEETADPLAMLVDAPMGVDAKRLMGRHGENPRATWGRLPK